MGIDVSDGFHEFGWSYRQAVTAVWRYQVIDQEFTAVVLSFGGVFSLVVADDSVVDAYVGDNPVDMSECVTREGEPKSGFCTFGY